MKSQTTILRTIFGSTLPVLALSIACVAQQPLPFQNPSFEDQPDFGKPPVGWFYCGNFGETPPDIHPGGFYGVETLPKDGQTYVGMVVRDNGTEEQLGQRLAAPLVLASVTPSGFLPPDRSSMSVLVESRGSLRLIRFR